jgi:cob(I)alamin adenosyltransferase
MPKIPDFSQFTKKLDIQGIVDSVKSVINPAGAPIANPPSDDELAIKFAQLHGLVQNLASVHAQQAKEIAELNASINGLYKDMLELKKATLSPASAQSSVEEAINKDEDRKL